MTHHLKTLTPYWERVESGEKTFEVRRHDRDFHVGDILCLQRVGIDPQSNWTAILERRVTYVLQGGQFGISTDKCLAFSPLGPLLSGVSWQPVPTTTHNTHRNFGIMEWNPRDETIFRTTAAAFLAIDEEGVLTIDPYSDYSDNRNLIELGCPENALTMADAYATVSGGWFDPKEEGGVEK